MNKKGFDYQWNWPELYFFVLLVLGVIVAAVSPSPGFAYFFVFLVGIGTGRFLFQKKGKHPIVFYLIIAGFVVGYNLTLLITQKASWQISMVLFVLANFISYYIHEKGYIND
jgi:uncharacterized membrane protein